MKVEVVPLAVRHPWHGALVNVCKPLQQLREGAQALRVATHEYVVLLHIYLDVTAQLRPGIHVFFSLQA
jgi:hypothetical protein